jgi:hypothetical protein
MINARDIEKDDMNVEKDFEVEHFYINFTTLIMGEKIRMQIDNEEHKRDDTYRFDMFKLS